jgi:integrase
MRSRKLPKGVQAFTDRHGKPRYYLRRKGFRKVPLPGAPWSTEFMDAYARALEGQAAVEPGKGRAKPGTMNLLAQSYMASPLFTTMARNSQKAYRLEIERFCREHGDKRVAELQGHHVRKLMDTFGARTGAANQLRKVLRLMMQHAIAIGMRRDDPTRDVKAAPRKSQSHHPWTDGEIAQFESNWPIGTRERLAFALLLHTGQRSGDVRRMGPQHVQGGALHVTQEKTGTELLIPISASLQAVIDGSKIGHLAYVTTRAGTIFPPTSFYQWFKCACRDAGLSHCSPHGLRHSAGRRMAEANVSPLGIASVTGHKSLREVTRYTQSADQRRLAEQAIAAIEQSAIKQVSNLDTGSVQPKKKRL